MTKLIVHTDGGARGNPGPAGIGVVILDQDQVVFEIGEFIGEKTNNEAEYLAFLTSAKVITEKIQLWQPTEIEWQLDSKLVVEQLNRKWKIKEPRMSEFAQEIWQHLKMLSIPYKIVHIPRALNAAADALVNQALDAAVV